MKHYLRLLAGLVGFVVLCTTQLISTAHAGLSLANLRVNLAVTTTPPAAPVTVNGAFTYGVTCIGTILPQFVLVFPPPAFTIAVNSVTPVANSATISTGTQAIAENTCTFTQLTRPAAPAGLQWSGSPPDVVIPNIVLGSDVSPPLYTASFANVLVLPTVTGNANPTVGGTVACTSLTTAGGTSTCTATTNPGFAFAGFTTSGCGGPSSANPYTTASVSTNCTVTAAFAPIVPTAVPTLNSGMLIVLALLTLAIGGVITVRRSR